jgi:hypothetical protein
MIYRTLRISSLLLFASVSVHAQDVSDFLLGKTLSHTQSVAGLTTPLAVPFGFTATANTVNGGLLGATVGSPGGSVLSLNPDGPDSWSTRSTYRTSAVLEPVMDF